VLAAEKSAAPIDLKPTSVDVVPQPTATTPEARPDLRGVTSGRDLDLKRTTALLASLEQLSDEEVNQLYDSMHLEQGVAP